MRSSSPTCSCFARFTRSPLTSTLPLSIAVAASARVLKKRAAQSHLSSLTRPTSSEVMDSLPVKRVRSQEDKKNLQPHGAADAPGRLVDTIKENRARVRRTPARAIACVQEAAERGAASRPGAYPATWRNDRRRRAAGPRRRARRRTRILAVRELVRIRALRLPRDRSRNRRRWILGRHHHMARPIAQDAHLVSTDCVGWSHSARDGSSAASRLRRRRSQASACLLLPCNRKRAAPRDTSGAARESRGQRARRALEVANRGAR